MKGKICCAEGDADIEKYPRFWILRRRKCEEMFIFSPKDLPCGGGNPHFSKSLWLSPKNFGAALCDTD